MRRVVLICALAASAGLHLALVPEHLREAPRVGVAFALGAAAAILLAALLLRAVTRALLAGAVTLLAGMIGAYAVAATVGLGFLGMGREPVDDVALACKAIEVVGLLSALSLLARPERLRRARAAVALAALAGAGGALAPHALASGPPMAHAAAGGSMRSVAIPARTFVPGELVALTGDTVTWTNGDSSSHTVTSDDDLFDSGPIPPGGSFSHTFTKPGVYAYHCSIHRFMRGVIRVFGLALVGPEHPLRVGSYATLSGLAPAGTQTVAIARDGAPYTVVHVSPGGVFAVHVRVGSSARYRASAGTAASPTVRVVAQPAILLRARGGRLSVQSRPAQPHAELRVEAYSRDLFRWLPFARGRLDAHSQAVLRVHVRRALHLRARTIGVRGFAGGTSNVVVVSP